jgi:hypothetical protein
MKRLRSFASRIAELLAPAYTVEVVPEPPTSGSMVRGIVYAESRGGVFKWAHFLCPECAEEIRIPLGTSDTHWQLIVDHRGKPSLYPSVWQTGGCGAHFFLRDGRVLKARRRRHS